MIQELFYAAWWALFGWVGVALGDIIQSFKPILEISALILSLINGLILIWYFSRDRPKLKISPVHPDVYQWYFLLPEGKFEEFTSRKFGFLVYIGISNKGLRDVQVISWRLEITSKNNQKAELKPISIQDPEVDFGHFKKIYGVFGIRSPNYSGETLVKSGCSISGFAYFIYECYGNEEWDPQIENGKIKGIIKIEDVYGYRMKQPISLSEISLEKAKTMVPNIEKIDTNI